MVSDLDLRRPEPGTGRFGRALATGLAAALLTVAAGACGGAFLLLAGTVLAGVGFTYLSRLGLRLEERIAYGAVIGAVVVPSLGFLAGLGAGFSGASALGALVVALGISLPGWRRAAPRLGTELAEAARRWRSREPWPLWLLLAVAWPFTLVILSRAFRYTEDGLVAGNVGVWGDWAAHLTYAASFAYSHNFPPQFPILPLHRMAYPFLVDYWAAMAVPLGTPLPSALTLTSGLLGLAFPVVMYHAGLRLIASRGGAALAVLVFALGGGLGFTRLGPVIARGGLGALRHLPFLVTQDPPLNYQWLNPVLAWLLPQRSALLGFSVVLVVLALLWLGLGDERRSWAPFALAGALAGLAPLCHPHSYGTAVALPAFWALFSRRRQWVAFFAPALLLGLPVLAWEVAGGEPQLRAQLWWMANSGGHQDGPLWFWLKNTGLFIPALVAAFCWRGLLPPGVALHLAPIWLWFAVPNLLVFQPWDWDNTKFFSHWALLGALPVGGLLARLGAPGRAGRRWPAAALAGGLAGLLMLSGGLDLARSLDTSLNTFTFTDGAGLAAAGWVRQSTDPHAVFAVAPDHNEPIPSLTGRREVVGYSGWLYTYGLLAEGERRTDDLRRLLDGAPDAPALVRRYGVDYVVIGPAEIQELGASRSYWERAAAQVYANGEYTIYRVGGK